MGRPSLGPLLLSLGNFPDPTSTMNSNAANPPEPLEFRGGWIGALAPFAIFLAGVTWLGLSGAPDERGFWPILLAALTVSMLLARDRQSWAGVVLRGMSQPIVMLMIMAIR